MKEEVEPGLDYLRCAAYLDEAGRNLGLILYETDEHSDMQTTEWHMSDESEYLRQVRDKIQELIEEMLAIYQEFKAKSDKN